MNFGFYNREINKVIEENNKKRVSPLVTVVTLLLSASLIVVFIFLLISIETVFNYTLLFIEIALLVIAIPLVTYEIIVIVKRVKYVKAEVYPLIMRIISNETGYYITQFQEPPKPLILESGLILASDSVGKHFTGNFDINGVAGQYMLLYITRPQGKSTTVLLNGDFIILPYNTVKRIYIRDVKEYPGKQYRLQKGVGNGKYYVYRHIDNNEPLSDSKEQLFARLKQLYPIGVKAGLSFYENKLAFYASYKHKFRVARTLNKERIKDYTEFLFERLKKVEQIITILGEY